jgi:hypothetical protein
MLWTARSVTGIPTEFYLQNDPNGGEADFFRHDALLNHLLTVRTLYRAT